MQHLSELFDSATGYCQQFADLLEQERQALLRQDMDSLQALIAAKTPLINTLSAAQQAIAAHLQQLGKPASLSAGDFIRSLQHAELAERHTRFLNAAELCQNANLQNARLIRHSQHINGSLLDLLRNQGEVTQSVYDRQGNTSRTGPGRPISRA